MSDMARSYKILRNKMSPAAREAAARKEEMLTEIVLRENSQGKKEALVKEANNPKGI